MGGTILILYDVLMRMLGDLEGRFTGPLKFRLIMQPLTAIVLASIAGVHDARVGSPPYLHTVIHDATQRARLLRDGARDIGRVWIIAIAIDAVYQFIVFRWFYIGETLLVGFLLACVPYALARGPVGRLARRRRQRVRNVQSV
jgi:hypothetical protein